MKTATILEFTPGRATFLWSPRKGVNPAWRVGAQFAVLPFGPAGAQTASRPNLDYDFSDDDSDATTLAERLQAQASTVMRGHRHAGVSDGLRAESRRVSKASRRTFWKYVKLLDSEAPMSKADISALASVLGGRKSGLSADDISTLLWHVEQVPERSLTRNHTEQGIAWLRKKCFRKDGTRRTQDVFGTEECRIVAAFSHFTWIGYIQVGYGSNPSCVPAWRTHAEDGTFFDYYVQAYGPGTAPEITVCARGRKTLSGGQ